MRDFRKYEVGLNAIKIVDEVYRCTDKFPQSETYALSNQIQRAAVSIPSNIAEGASRESAVDFARFLEIALGSAYEVETQIVISYRRTYINYQEYQELLSQLQSVEKQLSVFINKLRHS